MTTELKSSKKKLTSADPPNAAINGAIGYVSVSEVRNLFTERMRQLDTVIWPRGQMPQRDEIIDFYATTAIALMQRAQLNYEQFCRTRSIPQKPTAPTPEEDSSKQAYEARKAKLEKWHKD